MFNWFRRQRRQRLLRKSDTSPAHWAEAWNGLSLLEGLDNGAGQRLRELAAVLGDEKAFSAAHGMRITRHMRQFIALQACLPVLELDLDWYRGWHAIVIYPDTFVSDFDTQDEAGVVHRVREPRSGESWDRGPLILSWADALSGGRIRDGYNVVIHECAHKLDALDGAANGKPPLHADMSVQQWADVFGAAYEHHGAQVENQERTLIDPYAAADPAEFFAVMSEAFFETPHDILGTYPDIYPLLRRFYGQDPARRLAGISRPAPATTFTHPAYCDTPSCKSRRSPPPKRDNRPDI